MVVLVDNGRYVLAEAGSRLLFFERRILPTWAVFVPGLLVVIGLGNVVVQAVLGNVAAAGVILLVTVVAAVVLRAVARSRRRSRAEPLTPTGVLLQIDLAARTLLDGDGVSLAALDAAVVRRSMQLASSAPALVIAWPGGQQIVHRGDGLSLRSSITEVMAALSARGVPVRS